MSIRVDSTPLIAGALVCGDTGFGILAQNVPSGGDSGPGYIYSDLTFPADNGKEVRGLITQWPALGTLFAYEDTSFTFTGPDGTHTFTYQLYVDGVASGAAQTVQLSIGDQAGGTVYNLSIQSSAVELSSDSMTLVALGESSILVNDATVGLTAANQTLSSIHALTIASATNASSSSVPSLDTVAPMIVADATSSIVSTAANLTSSIIAVIANAINGVVVDSVALSMAADLAIHSAIVSHRAQSADLYDFLADDEQLRMAIYAKLDSMGILDNQSLLQITEQYKVVMYADSTYIVSVH